MLSSGRDPYRLDTPANHRDAKWFAEQHEYAISGRKKGHLEETSARMGVSASAIVRSGAMRLVHELEAKEQAQESPSRGKGEPVK